MQDFLGQLFTWYNVIYALPLLFVGLYALLHLLGTEFGMGDHFGDVGIDVDDTPSQMRSGLFWWLHFLRIGEAPFMLVVGMACLSWSVLGLTLNYAIAVYWSGYPRQAFPVSVLFAAGLGLGLTKLFVEVLVLLFPTAEHPAVAMRDLVGHMATVLSEIVDASRGRARVTDADGQSITLFCRSQEDIPIRRGDEVILIDYDTETHLFEVEKLDASEIS